MTTIDERSIAGYFDLDAGNNTGKRGAYLWRVAALVSAMLFLALPLYDLWEGLRTHQWNHFHEVANYPLYVIVFLPWAIGIGWFPYATVSAAVSRVWRAAAQGDDAIAPLAATQPEPSREDEHSAAVEVLGPLRGIKDRSRIGMFWTFGVLFVVFALGCGLLSIALGHELIAQPSALGDPLFLFYAVLSALSLSSLVLLFYGIRLPVLARRLGRGLSVTADETDLAWRDTRWRSGRRRIVWSEAEAFITIMCQGSGEPPRRVYALKAGGTTLLWSITTFMSRQEHAASDRLRCLIVTRTGLPLRDVTAISRAAIDEFTRAARPRGARSAIPATHSHDAAPLLDTILPHDFIADSVRKARRMQLVVTWLCLPYSAALVISAVLPWFQGRH